MNRTFVIVLVGSSFLVGLSVGRFGFRPQNTQSAQVVEARTVLPIDGTGSALDGAGEPVECRTAFEQLQTTIAEANQACELRIDAAGCVEPLKWPDAGVDDAAPAVAKALLEEAESQCPELEDELVQFDCDEYPCGMYFEADLDKLRGCGHLTAPPSGSLAKAVTSKNGHTLTALWLRSDGDVGLSDDIQQRTMIRIREAADMIPDPK